MRPASIYPLKRNPRARYDIPRQADKHLRSVAPRAAYVYAQTEKNSGYKPGTKYILRRAETVNLLVCTHRLQLLSQ